MKWRMSYTRIQRMIDKIIICSSCIIVYSILIMITKNTKFSEDSTHKQPSIHF